MGEDRNVPYYPTAGLGIAEGHARFTKMTRAARLLLEATGEDPNREGLRGTPDRVAGAWNERTAGYWEDPAQILSSTFGETEGYDQLIVVANIPFSSTCEHHLMPFAGVAAVGYIPAGGRCVGLSKIPRLVDCFSKRLQIQERITKQVADAMQNHLEPLGVGVILTATHDCIECRGIKKAGVTMTTSAMLGALRDVPEARAEFLQLAGGVTR